MRLPGEWILIKCKVPDWATITNIGLNPLGKTGISYTFYVDGKKIKLVSKNVFNITRLAYNDSGQYTYGYYFQRGNLSMGIVGRYDVLVLKEGKICFQLSYPFKILMQLLNRFLAISTVLYSFCKVPEKKSNFKIPLIFHG